MNDLIDFDVIDEYGPQTYRGTYDFSRDEIAREEVTDAGGNIVIEANVATGDAEAEYVADGN